MRKIVAGLFISLDGVVEAPETWHFPYFDEAMGAAVADQMAAADTLLLGRRTYEEFAAYWPHQGPEVEMAAYMNDVPKLVVSNTLESAGWANTSIIGGDVAGELRRRKAQVGRDLSISGSPTLVRSLLREGLVDELHLLVHPIVVGHGKRLFDEDGAPVLLRLLASETFGTGVVHLTYAPAAA